MGPSYYFPPVTQTTQSTHDLNTLADFADTLDALPLELTRGFSDLRELDAVLSSSLIHLTESIKGLTAAVNDPSKTPGERLILLKEVAEFAQRFKLGGEDKIRVVGGVCEGVISHQTHLLSLLSHSTLLQPRSAPLAEGSSYLPPTLPGKRTRARAGAEIGGGGGGGTSGVNGGSTGPSGNTNGGAPTPVKKRKVGMAGRGGAGGAAEDDDGGGRYAGTSGRGGLEGGRSPKLSAAVPKKSAASKKKATDSARPTSPFPAAPSPRPSSRLPATSTTMTSTNEMDHLNLVDSVTAGGVGYGAGIDDLDTTAASSSSRPAAKKRRAGGNATTTTATSASATPGASTGHGAAGGTGGGDDESSSEDGPARPPRRRKAHAVRPRAGYVSESSTTPPPSAATAAAAAAGASGAASGNGAAASAAAAAAAAAAAGAEGKVDIEDGVAYCYCAGPSYGEMIGCDSEECEREWFHLECLQLSSPPEGTWYCPTCQKEKDDEATAKKGKGGRGAPVGGGVKRRV